MSTRLGRKEKLRTDYELPKQERDTVERRIMELSDDIRDGRSALLTYILEQVDAQELSRFEAFKHFVRGSFMAPDKALQYIVVIGQRYHDKQNWVDVASYLENRNK